MKNKYNFKKRVKLNDRDRKVLSNHINETSYADRKLNKDFDEYEIKVT